VRDANKIEGLVRKLISDGGELQQSRFGKKYATGTVYYLDPQGFHRWRASCSLLSRLLGPSAEPWKETLEAQVPNKELELLRTLGVLEAIRDALEDGLLVSFEDLVFAEAFSDLSEQADYLLSQKYHLAAGVLYRAVLEEKLRRMCTVASCLGSKKRASINDYNAWLYKAKVYDVVTMKHIESMAAIGNQAAHNDDKLDPGSVERLSRDLQEFLVRHA